MLEDSGELDTAKLDFIEGLPLKYEKWLAELFACELHSFAQVYFFGKFKLSGENFLSEHEFESFCKDLVSKKILNLVKRDSTELNKNESQKFMDSYFYSFDFKSDTIKQWLQISSEGSYSFRFETPDLRFMSYLNEYLVTEKSNIVLISGGLTPAKDTFRIATVVNKINANKFDVSEETYDTLSIIFKACKKLEDSRDKEILYVELVNKVSEKVYSWNSYNYNDKGKIIQFRDSPSSIIKLKSSVEGYNDPDADSEYTLNIWIDKINQPDLKLLQSLIISSGDAKKIGIILDDKMDDLVRLYIKESNVKSSLEIADFFYNLFEEGHDLDIRQLNNTSYVFIENDEFDKATTLLTEAKRKIKMRSAAPEELSTAALVFYNSAITDIKREDFQKAIDHFQSAIDILVDLEGKDDAIAVLKRLEIGENNKLIIVEVKEGDRGFSKIRCRDFAESNIKILNEIL